MREAPFQTEEVDDRLRDMEELSLFRNALQRFFQKKVRDDSEVEDLVHDVFVRIAQRKSGGSIDNLSGYIFETASNVLRDRARRRKVRAAELHDPFDVDEHGGTDFAPDRILDGQKRLHDASVALLELPERTRHVFILRRLEGLRYQDIAARLGLSVSGVEKHMRQAMAFLYQRLDMQ